MDCSIFLILENKFLRFIYPDDLVGYYIRTSVFSNLSKFQLENKWADYDLMSKFLMRSNPYEYDSCMVSYV